MNRNPNSEKIGEALREVSNYPTIRGKFESVHEDLKILGITKVVIGEDHLDFVGIIIDVCLT